MNNQIIILVIQIIIIIIISMGKNPHPPGSKENNTIRMCKTGMALAVLSFNFGLIGFILAGVALILGVAGIIKGKTFYGIRILIAAIFIPIMGVAL